MTECPRSRKLLKTIFKLETQGQHCWERMLYFTISFYTVSGKNIIFLHSLYDAHFGGTVLRRNV